jgi:hypothetical protein
MTRLRSRTGMSQQSLRPLPEDPAPVRALALARGDGRYAGPMRALGGEKLLILNDWGLVPLLPSSGTT